MRNFQQLLQDQMSYLNGKHLMYRSLYQKYFETLLKTDEVIVIQGQRRVGKSSFVISYLKENHIDLKKVFYLNKELDIEEMVRDSGDLQECFNTFRNLYGKPDYLIIDEIQMIKNRELFINGQRAKGGTRIIITGSNSKLLSGELATNLTGRHLTIQIFPLSYEEFLQFNQKEQSDETFLEYLEFGGMP
ncbi:MAG: AAA family ATPase [Candidatus Peribacteria bacterium]|jgi:predicted AAA+ superfamily ATPase|nr:AAA family ATPase [Candidatus Peribacteria bacterium]